MTTEQERHNWLRLALMPHIGAETFLQLIRCFGTATAALQADAAAVRQVLVRKATQEAWANRRGEAEQAAEAAEKWSEQENCRLLLLCDEDFPAMLSEGIPPPPMLFVRGNVGLLHRPSVAIVGSRHATPQALRIAHDFGRSLSERGISVVSGMAAGIDAAAHRGALAAGGGTVAFWGTGIDRIYPSSNRELAYELGEKGAIVSEFPLGTRPLAGNFPRRNRLIAALSQAVLVVEAALESGSLITARLAGEMGREVLAVEANPATVRQWTGRIPLVEADATDVEALEQLGATEFGTAVVGVATSLEASVLITGNLVDLETPQIWAKAISRAHGRILRRIGAQHVVYPEFDAGQRAAHLVSGRMLDYIEMEKGGFTIVKMRPPTELHGFTIGQSKVRSRYGVTVFGLMSPGEPFEYATPDTLVSAEDVLVVGGDAALLERFANRA